MTVPLTARDLSLLRATQDALLAPISAPGTDWIPLAAAAVRRLLDASHATVLATGPELLYTTLPDAPRREFMERYAALDEATPRALARGLCAAHLYDVLSPEEFLASELHNEFAAPHRLFDAMLLRAHSAAGRSVWVAAQHPRELTEEEITKRRMLLSLVLPAFTAGVTLHEATARHDVDRLARQLDALPAALLVVDSGGRVLHANRALDRLLAADPGGAELLAEMKAMGMALLREGEKVSDCRPAEEMVRVSRTHLARYRLCAAPAGELTPHPAATVHLARLSPTPLDAEWMRERFGLTAREIQVAQLLAERLTNREIARALGISEHTAERHTERILQKLAVHSRAEVGRMVGEGSC